MTTTLTTEPGQIRNDTAADVPTTRLTEPENPLAGQNLLTGQILDQRIECDGASVRYEIIGTLTPWKYYVHLQATVKGPHQSYEAAEELLLLDFIRPGESTADVMKRINQGIASIATTIRDQLPTRARVHLAHAQKEPDEDAPAAIPSPLGRQTHPNVVNMRINVPRLACTET